MSEATLAPAPVEVQKGWGGQSVKRKEDKRLLQGEGVFVDDIKRHGMGYLHFVRSPYAHAHITRVDVSAAEAIDGVYGTLTGEEVAALTDPFFQISSVPGANIKDFALAVGKVRYVGEPIVAVVAETRELARDASELVEVDYEPLGAVVDARTAQDADTPVLHDEAEGNLMWSGLYSWGDLDAAFAEADRVIKIPELHFHRFNSTPLECDGALVEYNRGVGQWTIHTNNQFPGFAAIMMGPAMKVGLDKLRFVTQDIGGGFGNKITSHPQLVVCCLLARKLKRPVQWTEWRTDFHLSMSHGNERWFQDTEVAVSDDGTLLGFRTKALDDAGAWLRYEPLGGVIWAQVTPGMYRWRHVELEFTQVATNKAPVSPNRGYSRMQHLWFTERVIDIVARELGLDPVEVRKRNYIRAEDMPYETPNGCVYDSGDYAGMLDLALELIGYDSIPARRAEAEARGQAARRRDRLDPRLRHEQLRPVAAHQPGAPVLGQQRGRHGQARHLRRDRRHARHDAAGPGARDDRGSGRRRHPQLLGRRRARARRPRQLLELARRLLGHVREPVRGDGAQRGQGRDRDARGEIKKLAGAVFGGVPAEALELADGGVRIKESPDAFLPFMACGAIINANNAGLPEDLDVTLNCRYVYRPPFEVPDVETKMGNLTLTYAAQIHVAVVEVDPETGAYEVVDYAAVDDCGKRINPQIVEGQVMGATAQALGAAVHETFEYDEDGNLLTPNFYDYHVPHALDMPPLATGALESPSPFTPLGTKGMGEGGGAGIHAICAAIQDATGAIVTDSHNPYQRVWRLLQEADA